MEEETLVADLECKTVQVLSGAVVGSSGKQLEGSWCRQLSTRQQRRTARFNGKRWNKMRECNAKVPKVAPIPCLYVPALGQHFGKISLTAMAAIDSSAGRNGHCPKRATVIHVAMLPFRPCQKRKCHGRGGRCWSGAGLRLRQESETKKNVHVSEKWKPPVNEPRAQTTSRQAAAATQLPEFITAACIVHSCLWKKAWVKVHHFVTPPLPCKCRCHRRRLPFRGVRPWAQVTGGWQAWPARLSQAPHCIVPSQGGMPDDLVRFIPRSKHCLFLKVNLPYHHQKPT